VRRPPFVVPRVTAHYRVGAVTRGSSGTPLQCSEALIWHAQTGLPEIRDTRSAQKVVASREKVRMRREWSCYYTELGMAAVNGGVAGTSKSLNAGGSGRSRAEIWRWRVLVNEPLATRPALVAKVTRCRRSSSSRSLRHESPVTFSTTRISKQR